MDYRAVADISADRQGAGHTRGDNHRFHRIGRRRTYRAVSDSLCAWFAFRFMLFGRSRYNTGLLAAALLVALAARRFHLLLWPKQGIATRRRGALLCRARSRLQDGLCQQQRSAFLRRLHDSRPSPAIGGRGGGHRRVAAGPLAARLRRWRLAALLLAVGTLVALAAVFKARTSFPTLWCIAHAPPAGDRYRYLLRLMLLWGLLLVFEGGGWRRVAAAALLGFCVLGAAALLPRTARARLPLAAIRRAN